MLGLQSDALDLRHGDQKVVHEHLQHNTHRSRAGEGWTEGRMEKEERREGGRAEKSR